VRVSEHGAEPGAEDRPVNERPSPTFRKTWTHIRPIRCALRHNDLLHFHCYTGSPKHPHLGHTLLSACVLLATAFHCSLRG